MIAFVVVACGGGGGGNGAIGIATVTPPAGPGSSPGTGGVQPPVAPAPTSLPFDSETIDLSEFIFPIDGACLPKGDQLMPNAPRDYRHGTHEGIDMYAVDNCTVIGLGTPVMAARAGRVIRVDTNYVNLTPETLSALLANPAPPESLDAFRGRQVWIYHGGGVVTRYCHLSGTRDGLKAGDSVAQGDVIGYVGESGTPESVSNPGHEYHLHFELRIGDTYLGAGQSPAQVRSLYLALFSP